MDLFLKDLERESHGINYTMKKPHHFEIGIFILILDFFSSNSGKSRTSQCFQLLYTPPETNSSPLKINGWKMNFLLGPGLFSGSQPFGRGPARLLRGAVSCEDGAYRFTRKRQVEF